MLVLLGHALREEHYELVETMVPSSRDKSNDLNDLQAKPH